MAGRNAAAAEAAFLLIVQIWESLINGKYFKEACKYQAPPCPTCKSPKHCNNYFCVQCKTEGLCPIVFRSGDHAHRNHPWLQVRHYTRQYSVLLEDLEHFISKEGLKHIHTNKLKDGKRHCNLRSKQVAGASSSSSRRTRARVAREKSCQGCMASIHGSKGSRQTFLVCSLQCLIKVARERSKWDLVAMKDGVMKHMEPPLFFTEKLLKSPRMLETVGTATPVDEAPPSPQATGDCPMSEIHEPGPATEDLSMLEKPAAPAETPQLETASLPNEFEGLNDISLEWIPYLDMGSNLESGPLEEPEL